MKLLDFIKLLRVEPLIFLFCLQNGLKQIPTTQLLQDKICRFWYNQTHEFCLGMAQMPIVEHSYRCQILTDTAVFSTYQSLLMTIPALLWCLFIGSWVDRYTRGRKIIMIITSLAAIIETLLFLHSSIKFNLSKI